LSRDGLLGDKTRPSRIEPLKADVLERVVPLTLTDRPVEATHWAGAMMAEAIRFSVISVQRVWRAYGLQPHRVRQFKLSNDPKFVDKLRDVVGLYVDPPAHATDEKRQIQALDRTSTWSSLEAGTCWNNDPRLPAPWYHNAVCRPQRDRRNRDRTQYAAPSSSEFIRFLNAIEAEVPAGKAVHAILDNYAAHKYSNVRRRLDRHQRFSFHFTPTWCSWLNAVESFFAKLTKRLWRCGVFVSVVDL
jgi:hypothetical protein